MPLDDPLAQRDLGRLAAIKAERAQAASDYFRANAGRWDVIRRMHVADSEVEQALLASLPPGPLGDVVDLGTGTGRMLELVAGRASRLVGIDRSREMLALARTKLERANARGWQVRHGDVHALPLADESFDVALMHQVLHFLKDPEEALQRPRGSCGGAAFSSWWTSLVTRSRGCATSTLTSGSASPIRRWRPGCAGPA